jgi:hypothetical protein
MRIFKQLGIAAALGLASAAAFAQPSVPPQPAPGPTPDPNSGNSGIIVSAYDTARGLSIVQYLGINMNDFLPSSAGGSATPEAGLTLDFGTVSQWSSVFGNDSVANAGIHWSVSGFDGTTTDVTDTYLGKGLITTFASAPSSIFNTAMNGAINAAVSFIAGGLDGAAACNGGNPCVALSSSDGAYAGSTASWGDKYKNQLPISAASNVGTSMAFYLVAANSNSGGQTKAPFTRFENSGGAAAWLLTADGHLTYTLAAGQNTVPLPAAAWLLLSGLAGVGVVGRRQHRA